MVDKIDSRSAKQGRSGRRVFVILVASFVLALVAWVIADIYFAGISPGDKQLPAEKAQTETQNATTPEQHLDNPKQAVPQQTKPLPDNVGQDRPGDTKR